MQRKRYAAPAENLAPPAASEQATATAQMPSSAAPEAPVAETAEVKTYSV